MSMEEAKLSHWEEEGGGELTCSVNGDERLPVAGLCRPVSPTDSSTKQHNQKARDSDDVGNDRCSQESSAPAEHNGHSSWEGEEYADFPPLHFVTSAGTDGDEVHDQVTQLTSQGHPPQRPGVILLGRGNSFSLGRSEVILLHGRHRRAKGEPPDPSTPAAQNGDSGLDAPPSSPPQFSTAEDDVCDLQESERDEELEQLWRRAEAVMLAKRGAVLKVMEDFGISQGEGGTQLPQEEEEEEVWRAIQEQADLSR